MKTLVSIALAAALAAPAVAFAAGPYGEAAEAIPMSDAVTIAVTDRGLDLSRPHDAAVMLRRISAAALEACGASDFSLPDYRRSVEGSACFHDGVGQAIRQLNAPGVNALYGQTTSKTLLASN